MSESEALDLLQLDAQASERQIRAKLFQHYQTVTTALATLDDERKRALLEAQLDRLNQARDRLLTDGSGAAPSPASLPDLDELPPTVVVLLYQRGGQEGIHTLRVQEQDIVLGFENSFAARKYAQRLAKEGLPKPGVESFEALEIFEFCQAAGFGLTVIPASETFDPPEAATETLKDWS